MLHVCTLMHKWYDCCWSENTSCDVFQEHLSNMFVNKTFAVFKCWSVCFAAKCCHLWHFMWGRWGPERCYVAYRDTHILFISYAELDLVLLLLILKVLQPNGWNWIIVSIVLHVFVVLLMHTYFYYCYAEFIDFVTY